MGKRSDFVRVEKDFYRTIDPNAVVPLLPFLTPETKYAEPCSGAGDLVNMLCSHGHVCLWDEDIQHFPYPDALDLTKEDIAECDVIITNPPWTRIILHAMIRHFVTLKPTWLLFDADWAHTKQSSELMKDYCTDIVSVGRLKWIPGTTMSGKDNCAWYKFDANKTTPTRFHGR